jgi:hypothetical protein
MKNRINCAILRNENSDDHQGWVRACEEYQEQIDCEIVDLTASNWLNNLTTKRFDILLARPPALTGLYKQLYDERIFLIDNVLKIPIYPSPIEIYIYENKRFFYSWLGANNIPHPKTTILYNKREAVQFVERQVFPIVAKVNIGASGSGVKILRTKEDALRYIEQSFSHKGAPRRWGPNTGRGGFLRRGFHYILQPGDIPKRISRYRTVKEDKQKGFVIFQEYIPHDFEWRIVAIGDSYFAHKKMKIADKSSGSLLKNYDNPPLYLFDFAKRIMEKYNFKSQAIDVFEVARESFLINEMQCIFGQSDPDQMLVNGEPGRYTYNDKWVFEKGDFGRNECYNLRISHILSLLGRTSESIIC